MLKKTENKGKIITEETDRGTENCSPISIKEMEEK
jgi:hypothetical protein